MRTVTISYDSTNDWYSVTGTCKDSEGNTVNVGVGCASKEYALKEFNYYSSANGFKCKRVNLL